MSDTEQALRVAMRAFSAADTTEAEQDAILAAIALHTSDKTEAEVAARALHHRMEARAHQLQLAGLHNTKRSAD